MTKRKLSNDEVQELLHEILGPQPKDGEKITLTPETYEQIYYELFDDIKTRKISIELNVFKKLN